MRRIRQLGCTDLKIFGLTGNLMPEDVERFMQAGSNLVLEKPLNLAAFEDAMLDVTFLSSQSVQAR